MKWLIHLGNPNQVVTLNLNHPDFAPRLMPIRGFFASPQFYIYIYINTPENSFPKGSPLPELHSFKVSSVI